MIERYGNTSTTPQLPTISQVVTHNGLIYLCGVTPDPSGDITTQTRQVLQRVETLLHRVGTDKSRLLSAQVWLSDMALFDEHNLAWNEWVDQHNPPARACVESRLWRDGMLVEVMAIAAAGE
jgi:enamine deaminase RidA (YjgF/YER057c/UK114 family)